MPADSSRAVFLSYAPQDAEATLRCAVVEVWFQSGLPAFADLRRDKRGGDAWDAKIRKQIEERAPFARGTLLGQLFERVEHLEPGPPEILVVAGYERDVMAPCGGGNITVLNGHRLACANFRANPVSRRF